MCSARRGMGGSRGGALYHRPTMSRPVLRAPAPVPPADLAPAEERTWRISVDIYNALDAGDAQAAMHSIAQLAALAPPGDATVAQYRKVAAIVGFRCDGARGPYDPAPVA